jgi:uncharacterized protein YcbX
MISTIETDFKGGKLCVRCSIPMVDQKNGVCGREPLQTLSGYRRLPALPGGAVVEGVVFGRNFKCHFLLRTRRCRLVRHIDRLV